MARDTASLPRLPANRWWALRRQFHNTLPKGAVDSNYLASVFQIERKFAQNLVPMLRTLGIVDDDLKPTELANRWRLDDSYAEACGEMLERTYPQGLLDAAPGPNVDVEQATRWIARHLGIGISSAQQAATTYALIAARDPAVAETTSGTNKPKATEAPQRIRTTADRQNAKAKSAVNVVTATQSELHETRTNGTGHVHKYAPPTVHIDLQIHISPNMSNDQIEKVFESMGKHLFARPGVD